MPFFAKSLTPGDAISRLGANDPTLVTCDLSKNAVLSMKVHELLPQFAKALESNTACTDLNLSACNIDDAGVAALAKGLSANSGLQTLNLEGNTIKDGGAQELAKAIASNSHLSTLNLLNQKGSRFGDSTLGEFLTMFETNVTLLKIVWRLESRQSFRLTKMLTRNNDIARRIKEGREYTDLLPSAVSGVDEDMIRMRASVASAVGMPGGDRASRRLSALHGVQRVGGDAGLDDVAARRARDADGRRRRAARPLRLAPQLEHLVASGVDRRGASAALAAAHGGARRVGEGAQGGARRGQPRLRREAGGAHRRRRRARRRARRLAGAAGRADGEGQLELGRRDRRRVRPGVGVRGARGRAQNAPSAVLI